MRRKSILGSENDRKQNIGWLEKQKEDQYLQLTRVNVRDSKETRLQR